jgi:CubicO group peptidase (beta-lactamase class C family)
VAKQFVAAAIILLSLEGKLGLDDPVKRKICKPYYKTCASARECY